MNALARAVTGRRTKWLVVAAWIVAVAALSPLAGRLANVTSNSFSSFLPAGAESTHVQALLRDRFAGGDTQLGLIVYRRPGGLTAADRAKIVRDAQRVAGAIPVVGLLLVPFTPHAPAGLVSRDGDTAYTVVAVPHDVQRAGGWGMTTRRIVDAARPPGLQASITGDVGLSADLKQISDGVETEVMLVTIALVLVLLGVIYRAPAIAVIPVIVVAGASQVAKALIYPYGVATGDISTNATTILVVLMFGVGTDYCLLLVSRYREELHEIRDKHTAMERALRRSGPALLASGATVICAMLVLLLAQAGSTKGLGPVSAIGVACALLAGVTLLPALLTIVGRAGFWPVRDSVAHRPRTAVAARRGIWRRIGDRVLGRPGLALGVTVAMFALFSAGLTSYKEDYSVGGFFREKVESVEGFRTLEREFPAGALDPTVVVAPTHRAGEVRSRVAPIAGVVSIGPPVASEDGRLVRLDVVFGDDPYSRAALRRVDTIRSALRGTGGQVGAGSAVQADFNRAAVRDLRVIVPAALLVIAVILGVLLRSLIAPVVLIATVMVSFLGTLGLSLFVFIELQGSRGVDASLPSYAFIFLVALGVDYTIFLMSRVREEARGHGTREGVLRALASTGPVITSAGIILAGTFAVLLTLPVTFAFDIGFMVATGILLDTFIVRTIMLPAAVELLGDRIWWPSKARRGVRQASRAAEAVSG